MAKYTLTIEDDFDFLLVAICSHSKDYRLSWLLNNHLGLALQKSEDLQMQEKNLTCSFSFYSYMEEENQLEYYLIGNRSGNKLLIPEEQQVDYFLQIKGPLQQKQLKEMIEKINSIPVVLTAFEKDIFSLKSRKNLLF